MTSSRYAGECGRGLIELLSDDEIGDEGLAIGDDIGRQIDGLFCRKDGLAGVPYAGLRTRSVDGSSGKAEKARVPVMRRGVSGFELQDAIDERLQLDQVRALVPAGVRGTVEDIANAVCFLASKEAGYINGHSLVVDGGWRAK